METKQYNKDSEIFYPQQFEEEIKQQRIKDFDSIFQLQKIHYFSTALIAYKIILSTYSPDKVINQEQNYKDITEQTLEKQLLEICSQDYLSKFMKLIKNILQLDFDEEFINKNIFDQQTMEKYLKPIQDKTNSTWKQTIKEIQQRDEFQIKQLPITKLLLNREICYVFQLNQTEEIMINEIVIRKEMNKENFYENNENKSQYQYKLNLILEIADFLQQKHKFKKAFEYYQEILPKIQQEFGEKSQKIFEIKLNMGNNLRNREKYKEAIQILEQLLTDFSKNANFSQKYQLQAKTYRELSNIYLEQQDTEKVEKTLKQEILIHEKFLPFQALAQKIEIYNIIGSMYQNFEQYEKAVQFFTQCEELFDLKVQKKQQMNINEYKERAKTQQNLGFLLEQLGKFEEAEQYYLKCIQFLEKKQAFTSSENQQDQDQEISDFSEFQNLANNYQNLGRLYFNMGRNSQSEEWYKKSHCIYIQNFGDEDGFDDF